MREIGFSAPTPTAPKWNSSRIEQQRGGGDTNEITRKNFAHTRHNTSGGRTSNQCREDRDAEIIDWFSNNFTNTSLERGHVATSSGIYYFTPRVRNFEYFGKLLNRAFDRTTNHSMQKALTNGENQCSQQ